MSAKLFRMSVANCLIVVVIAAVSFFAFTAPEVGVFTASASPIYKVNGGTEVSLMVNVYWGDEYIDDMLDVFAQNDITTTFFIGGCWAAKNEATLRKIFAAGHEIGNHGYFHKDHKKLNAARNKEEISANHNLIKQILGVDMTLFSPPSASFSATTLDVACQMGYTTIMYSKDTIDWRDKDSALIYKRATKNIVGGELVLMHPTAATVSALPDIIAEIKNKGLRITTVSEVLKGQHESQ